jgi:DNA-binding transcriptional LysR family regulator
MDIKLIQEFITLTDFLNFSVAAKRLFISQPLLTKHVATLERQVGAQLFIRNKHSVILTSIGKIFLENAKIVVINYEETIKKVQFVLSGLEGELKIGYLDAAVRNFFATVIQEFSKSYPNIEIKLIPCPNFSKISRALISGTVDVGFTLSMADDNIPYFNQLKVYTDVLSLVVRKDHPLAKTDFVPIASLAKEIFIKPCPNRYPGYWNFISKLCANNGFSPLVSKEADNVYNYLLMIEAGFGIAISPRHTSVYASPNLQYIDIKCNGNKFDIIAEWCKSNNNPAITFFIKKLDHLISNCRLVKNVAN